jgi:cell division septation protein DedD
MRDHEVHEIQLNGKQLVFMFMAATVVSVVIFLSGVMVGRGVRLPEADVLAASANPAADPTAAVDTAPRTALTTDPPPALVQENSLTYAEHLEAIVAPDEPLKPSPKPAAAPAAPEKASASKATAVRETREPPRPAPTVEKTAEKAVEKPEATGGKNFAEPRGSGFVVQVQAFPTKADADALAGRLAAKGYPTFVTLNEAAPRAKYRVRVGKYPTRPAAQAIAARLEREERFEPWVTR